MHTARSGCAYHRGNMTGPSLEMQATRLQTAGGLVIAQGLGCSYLLRQDLANPTTLGAQDQTEVQCYLQRTETTPPPTSTTHPGPPSALFITCHLSASPKDVRLSFLSVAQHSAQHHGLRDTHTTLERPSKGLKR